ncbi:hypothetical protein R6Q59_021383 [Mikania micrantha]
MAASYLCLVDPVKTTYLIVVSSIETLKFLSWIHQIRCFTAPGLLIFLIGQL